MPSCSHPILIAIVGGSGSGKSWITRQLLERLGADASKISLDDFYKDLSALSLEEREAVNFDDPAAIDWPLLESVLQHCAQGSPCNLPEYDFTTHCRKPATAAWSPTPFVLLEGLWLLHPRAHRSHYSMAIYVDCPEKTRLDRRLRRDVRQRGRTPESVITQFMNDVAPMHNHFVAPQRPRADVVLNSPVDITTVTDLTARIRRLAFSIPQQTNPHPNTL